MRKLSFCICENKDADQLCGNREADQRLCFRYTNSTIPLLSKFQKLAIFCGSTAWSVSDLVGNPEDPFSQNEAHFCYFASDVGHDSLVALTPSQDLMSASNTVYRHCKSSRPILDTRLTLLQLFYLIGEPGHGTVYKMSSIMRKPSVFVT